MPLASQSHEKLNCDVFMTCKPLGPKGGGARGVELGIPSSLKHVPHDVREGRTQVTQDEGWNRIKEVAGLDDIALHVVLAVLSFVRINRARST